MAEAPEGEDAAVGGSVASSAFKVALFSLHKPGESTALKSNSEEETVFNSIFCQRELSAFLPYLKWYALVLQSHFGKGNEHIKLHKYCSIKRSQDWVCIKIMLSGSWGTVTARQLQGWKWNGLDRSYCSQSHQCWWTENSFYSCTTNRSNSSPLETGLCCKSVISTPFMIRGKCQVLSGRVSLPMVAGPVLWCHTAPVRAAPKIWYCSSGEPAAKDAGCGEVTRSTSWSTNNSTYFSFIVDNSKCCFKHARVISSLWHICCILFSWNYTAFASLAVSVLCIQDWHIR